MRVRLTVLTLSALSFVGVREASPQDIGYESFGLRAGISVNPDQFYGGVFADMGRLIDKVRLRPSFELGWGNGVLLGAANADALYFFSQSSWRPYGGGGLGVNFIDVTKGVGEGRGLEIEPVLNLVGGVEWGKSKEGATGRYLLEGRLGLGETHDFKLSAGLRF